MYKEKGKDEQQIASRKSRDYYSILIQDKAVEEEIIQKTGDNDDNTTDLQQNERKQRVSAKETAESITSYTVSHAKETS